MEVCNDNSLGKVGLFSPDMAREYDSDSVCSARNGSLSSLILARFHGTSYFPGLNAISRHDQQPEFCLRRGTYLSCMAVVEYPQLENRY